MQKTIHEEQLQDAFELGYKQGYAEGYAELFNSIKATMEYGLEEEIDVPEFKK